jgi:uncharacterized protein YegP (UPF0339 family)
MLHLHKATDGQFYFTANAKNGKVLVTSETYKAKPSALKGMKVLVKSLSGSTAGTGHPLTTGQGYYDNASKNKGYRSF